MAGKKLDYHNLDPKRRRRTGVKYHCSLHGDQKYCVIIGEKSYCPECVDYFFRAHGVFTVEKIIDEVKW